MKKSTKLLSIISVFIITSILFLILVYLWIDTNISLFYMRQSYELKSNSLKDLQKILAFEWDGLQETTVTMKLEQASKQIYPENFLIKREGSIIYLNQIAFIFQDGKLCDIGNSSQKCSE